MKKVTLLILVSLVLLLAFTSCNRLPDPIKDKIPDSIANILGIEKGCKHQWTEASCTAPKTCSICGEREGSLLPHNLVDATCTEAKTCTLCKQTWGDPLGHKWSAGTCTVARTCKVCNVSEGEAPGHQFADATCEKPKTCKVCSTTEGDPLGHKYVDVVTAPTCTEDGYTTHTCANCDASYVDARVVALGHLNDVILEAVEVTCTEDGLTAGVQCSRCDTVTTKQEVITAQGHKTTSVVVEPNCTDKGYTEYTCSVCGEVIIGNEVPALGHDYGDAACGTIASCNREGCTDSDSAKPIEHEWADATCTEPKTCKRGCGATEGEPLGHNMSEASCLAPSTCLNKCGYTEGEKDPHVLSFAAVEGVPTYSCELCGSTYKLDSFYYINGEDYTNLTPGNNADHGYSVVENTHNPLIKEDSEGNKYYELLKKETTPDKPGQLQLWVPKEDKAATQFSAGNGGVGFISFKLNAFLDTNFSMRIVDGSSSPDRWSADWSIVENFFSIVPPTANEDETKLLVEVKGWNEKVLKTIEVTEDNYFTGWMDVIIGIELDANSDTITMHYYIDGEYCSSETKELTILTNAVNCFYISGNSTAGGSGIMIDDIVFGYTVAGYWCFDGHVHDWTLSKTVEPDCIHDGYSIYTCSRGCVRRDDFISSLGHVTEDIPELLPTCTETGYTAGKLCTVCGVITEGKEIVPANGHSFVTELTAPNCTDAGFTTYTCSVCSYEKIDDHVAALGHDFGEAKCTDVAVCLSCGFSSGDEPIGHNFAPATCTTPATCIREGCGVTEGDPIPHDMLAPTCVSPSVCSYGCGYSEGELGTHVLTHSYDGYDLKFVCSACEVAFELEDYVYVNGKNHVGMVGLTNSGNYTVDPGTQNPAIVDGHYELINTTGKRGQMQLWIPDSNSHDDLAGFSAENNAVGFVSFKLNTYITDKTNFAIRLVDNTYRNTSSFGWPKHSIIALTIKQAKTVDGVTTTVLTGMNGDTIATLTSENKFTGWVDFTLGIELDSSTNQITLHYYINGKIVSTYSETFTIETGKINAIYMTGYSSEVGSGIMLDDIAFGYAANGEWKYDDCEHNYVDEIVAPTCTEGGYSILTCSDCGRVSISDRVDPLGHTGGEATCTEAPVCERCGESYSEALGHTGGTPTCQALAVCERCGSEYGELQHVLSEATCQAASVCSVCNETIGEKASHKIVHRYAFSEVTYTCEFCNVFFKFNTNGNGYFVDGTDYNNLTPGLVTDYITEGGRPVIKEDKETGNKYYELINDKGKTASGAGKAEVWVPNGSNHILEGFTSENKAVGMLSFKLDAFMDGAGSAPLSIKLVDNSVRTMPGKSVWSDGCTDEIFMIKAPVDAGDGTYSIAIAGMDGKTLTTVFSDTKWTGWLDVKIGIILDPTTDTITLHYYINNVYCGSVSAAFKICTKRIDSAYFYGWSSEIGSGYRFDDIGFGFTANGSWDFEENK